MATGVKIMEFFSSQFALRGLGFTSHPGMAGIGGGVLFSMERMDQLTLTDSNERVSFGPGNHWGKVYEALEHEHVAVTGGQLAVVGVAGLLTGSMSPFVVTSYSALR